MAAADPAAPRGGVRVLAAALLVGTLVRVWIYLARPALWLDEARVALNIGTRSWGGLLQPLDFDQAAPPLFLWVTKLSVILGGMNEYALRLGPFLASLAVLPLVFLLADRLAGRRIATIATVLAAVSPGLVRHAAELKPYQVDALVAIGIICAYVVARRRHGFDAVMIALGVVAVWLSTTAVFVLATLAVTELWRTRRDGVSLTAVVPAGALWGISFAGAYAISYRHTAANSYLREFWGPTTLTIGQRDWPIAAWNSVRDVLAEGFVTGPLELPPGDLTQAVLHLGAVVLLVLAALGVRDLVRTRGAIGGTLVGAPWLVVFAASVAGLYPFAARLTLFALPLLIIAVAAGLAALDGQRPVFRLGLAVAFGGIFAAGVLWCVDRLAAPGWEDDIRPAVEFFRNANSPGEPVYVMAGALPAWAFYTTDWRHPDTTRLTRVAREASAGGPAFENAAPRGRRVDGDGADLVFEYNGWVELFGVYSGARWLSQGVVVQSRPDDNWARSEARRIREAAKSTAWVLASRSLRLADQLREAIEANGGRALDSYADSYVTMTRYRFETGTASTR